MSMTLTVISQGGIWQSTDFRLVQGRRIVADFSIKSVTVHCTDGIALIAYAGAGSVHNVEFSEWIRHFARGPGYSVAQLAHLLGERATEDLGALLTQQRLHHMFVIGASIQGTPWSIQVRNFDCLSDDLCTLSAPRREFVVSGQQVPEGKVFIVPWPNWPPSQEDQRLVIKLATRKLADPKDLSNVLARLNRNLAKSPITKGFISPYCITRYSSLDLKTEDTRSHGLPAGAPVIVPPIVFRGIDGTDILRTMMSATRAARAAGQKEGSFLPDMTEIAEKMCTPENLLDSRNKRR